MCMYVSETDVFPFALYVQIENSMQVSICIKTMIISIVNQCELFTSQSCPKNSLDSVFNAMTKLQFITYRRSNKVDLFLKAWAKRN